MHAKIPPVSITIAGSDCSGGAGIQADLKTFQALKCYGASVLTALTAQNTQGVQSVFPIPASFVAEQLYSLFNDIPINSVKIGMIHNESIIKIISKILQEKKAENIIVDPVMIAKSGHALLSQGAVEALKIELLKLSLCVTPNIPEAEILAGMNIQNKDDIYKAAKLIQKFCPNVLVKGGHYFSEDNLVNDFLLLEDGQEHWITYPRILSTNTHGTGCTFSAAIAAFLARRENLLNSVNKARNYLQKAIQNGVKMNIGKGCGPVDHSGLMG